ncbi:hypothetical protein BDY17DRAFT_322726 [Neohortaea acidophila]|uniref:FHA domain-containing protein n=1 Tax=Neohortaea acidophila TaxID=245834 RepID=A0A6A6PX28_9PEZI|nr:uncharacterized protein BDY17DRAFT_322726 [Neohortaea acidophila]KAF2483827.1 hypothetical protein BDY17DRAFT_322726 [Neohortaea acidophila]
MWLLTCDGDLFEGKRIWLRPGTTHILGRTTGRAEGGERIQYINNKSVSRKHLTIEVERVAPGDAAKLFTRSNIKITDGSKLGTTLNGEKIVQESQALNTKECTIKLGSYEHLFHLSWHPVTISFTSASKKTKHEALSGPRHDALEQADIKIISDYVVNETTHAVAKKRNTPPALHALIQARWLVTEAFVDALHNVATSSGPQDASALEQDFDANWPNEEQFFVPAATEPQPREDYYLKPSPDRADVFQHYTFIFLSQAQHNQLSAVINAGNGKALLKEVERGQDSVAAIADYVKQVAGRKGSAQFKLSQQTGDGGVVVVRWHERDEQDREFMRELDLALDQRSIEQNEFLDAILTSDASGLRRRLLESESVEDVNGTARATEQRSQSHQSRGQERAVNGEDSPSFEEAQPIHSKTEPPPSSQPDNENASTSRPTEEQEPTTAAKRRNRRIITQSRFRGFDDFDPSQFAQPASASPEPSQNNAEPSQLSGHQDMDVDAQPSGTQRSTRKRPLPGPQVESEDDVFADIAPAHAAMKRRKLEAARNGDQDGDSYAQAVHESERRVAAAASEQTKAAKGKKTKERDIMAEVQTRRLAEEERRRADEESLRQDMQDVDLKGIKALVEEMEMPARRLQKPRDGVEDAWDAAWNGRKNFKKFRKHHRGGGGNEVPELRRVIVTLEEMPRQGRGLGDEYWLNDSSLTSASTTSARAKARNLASQSQNARGSQREVVMVEDDDEDGDDADDPSRFRRRQLAAALETSRQEDEEAAYVDDFRPDEVAGRPRDDAIRDALRASNGTPSQTLRSQTQKGAAVTGKRAAAQQGGGPAKRARQTTLASAVVEDEDDDGLKFRRRR